IELPPLSSYATRLWDYWERNLDPDLFRDRSFEGAVNGKLVVITGASSGIGKAAAHKIARAGGIPILIARSLDKLEETKAEIEADGLTFTTIHLPLVKTPMFAPTKIYGSFPTITPDEAADMVCEAIRSKPRRMGTRLGTFGEVAYALQPKAVDQILHMAYKVFPDSAAAKGKKDPDEKASMEQIAMANLMKGVHW